MIRGYIRKGRPANWLSVKGSKATRGPAPKLKRKYIRSISPRKAGEHTAYVKEAREFVADAIRRGETCPVVAAIPELRNGFNYGWPVSNKLNEVHHVRGRAGSLLLDKRYWMAISKAGHRWIHAHVEEARKHGWICERGLWNVPVP